MNAREQTVSDVADATDDILGFWFGDSADADATRLEQHVTRWFRATPAFDREVDARYGPLIGRALAGDLGSMAGTPEGTLALILLLDQFTRNVFRGTPRAYAGDPAAQALCLDGLARAADRSLPPIARHFFCLPLLHAEDAGLQARSVVEFEALAAAAPAGQRSHFADCLAAARRYRMIIGRFGRFPHRNAVLGRETSDEERRFMEAGLHLPPQDDNSPGRQPGEAAAAGGAPGA